RVEVLGSPFAGRGIHRYLECGVDGALFERARMLAADRAVHDRGAGSLSDRARGPDRHRAINDRESGLKKLDVAGGLTNKILDLERVADMQDVDLLDLLDSR